MAIDKHIIPENVQSEVSAVDIIGAYSKGLDRYKLCKRASAFDDVAAVLKPRDDRTYLHVITTGAYEFYDANKNGDAWNESSFAYVFPYPEEGGKKSIVFGGGLKKYHDDTYMKDAHVYQEHKTKDTDPSGEVISAKYNDVMHRGELLIAVDTEKWAPRLQRKARGENIYLSIGASVPFDTCLVCGHKATTMAEHCNHFKRHRGELTDAGVRISVMNDEPDFYDISGVNVPADKIAFVLRKMDTGLDKSASVTTRRPMPYTKAASITRKLARMEKELGGIAMESGIKPEDPVDGDVGKLVVKVKSYPADLVIDSCSRKGMLLPPELLFRILGNECSDDDAASVLSGCEPGCCGDCSTMMQDMLASDSCGDAMLDGSFDSHLLPDIGLDNILEQFMPMLCMKPQAVKSRTIRIIIRQKPEAQSKTASLTKQAQDALRDTYARYLVSFARQNDDATCRNALIRIAGM